MCLNIYIYIHTHDTVVYYIIRYSTILHCIVLYHSIAYHIISYYVMSYHIISYLLAPEGPARDVVEDQHHLRRLSPSGFWRTKALTASKSGASGQIHHMLKQCTCNKYPNIHTTHEPPGRRGPAAASSGAPPWAACPSPPPRPGHWAPSRCFMCVHLFVYCCVWLIVAYCYWLINFV